ncbi:MAG TPA: glycosyltransferase family 39 protein, partial [Thermoanaerobaculia bacterium]|nr:glycosyltransferase family 39 protein [Thermoanaerobaculia bacterium]
PPLYPLLTAGLALLGIEPFTAARLLSNLAAAVLAGLAYWTARRLSGPTAGAWALALIAVNPNLWILGQHVTTDMLFAALGAAALAAGLAYLTAPGLRPALAAGAAFALAAFTRGNAVFLLPALLVAWWLAPGSRRGRLTHLGGAALVIILLLLPQWALRWAAFGDPFHDENWKNLAWKLHGYPDWSYLDRVPFRSGFAVLADDPGAVVRGGIAELARFATGGLPQLLGTWPHVLLFALGSAYALRRKTRPAAWLLFAGATFLAAVAFSFFTWGRFFLLLLPASYALAFAPWDGAFERAPMDRPSGVAPWLFRLAPPAIALALVLLLAVKAFAFRLPDFVGRHPYREVTALRRLDERLPPSARLAGTSPFLGRYLRHGYFYVPDAFGPEVADPGLYFRRLRPLLAGAGAAYLVVGGEDLRERPRSLLGPRPPVDWLEPVARSGAVAVWRVRPSAGG